VIAQAEAERLKAEALRLYQESREHKRRAQRERQRAAEKRVEVDDIVDALAKFGIEVTLEDVPAQQRYQHPSITQPKGGHSGNSSEEQNSQQVA
jgi:hypothetical protein